MNEDHKCALVTGAGTRLGRALAISLAGQGFTICAHYHTSEAGVASLVESIVSEGGRAKAIKGDLSKPEVAEEIAGSALDEMGRIDLLINNASVWKPTPLDSLSADQFDEILTINLRSHFLLSVRLGLVMKRNGSGHIINILDWSVDRPYADHIPYGIAKAGLAAATKGLARALAPEVRVNAVAPGAVLLPDATDPEQAEAIRRATPLHRIGKPEDVTGAVLYLIEADYATGTTITIDGGRSIR